MSSIAQLTPRGKRTLRHWGHLLLFLSSQCLVLSLVIATRNYTSLLLAPIEDSHRLSDYRRFQCVASQLARRLPEGSRFWVQADHYFWPQRLAELAFPKNWASPQENAQFRLSVFELADTPGAREAALVRDPHSEECMGAWLAIESIQ